MEVEEGSMRAITTQGSHLSWCAVSLTRLYAAIAGLLLTAALTPDF